MNSSWKLAGKAAIVILLTTAMVAVDSKDTSKKEKNPGAIINLTPEQMNLQLLESARSELTKASASLRTHTCFQASLAYGRIDSVREIAQLKQCFKDSLAIEEKDVAAKSSLQLRILNSLYPLDPDSVREFLPMAEARVSTNIQAQILQKLVDEKKYDEALNEMVKASYASDFPYKAAVALMLNLSANRDQDRRLAFTAALQSYRLEDPATDPKMEDMGTLVIRFWRDLPPQLVMTAIEEILDHAKKDLKNTNAPMLTIGTALGEAQFSTGYQYRLFELTPIIRELDRVKAESIERENPALSNVLKDYPQGLQSLEPTYRGTALRPGESPKFTMTHRLPGAAGVASAGAAADLMRDKLARQGSEIAKNMASDPRAALSQAMQLPDLGMDETLHSPRADTLARMATTASTKDIAGEALNDLVKVIANYPPIPQSMYLLLAARIYLLMHDTQNASHLVEQASAVAGKLYAIDSNHDRPNNAFKFDWPSTAVWRAAVILQNKIDPVAALGLVSTIKDPEIRANVQVTLANERLGVALQANTVRQQFGNDPGSVQDFPLVH